MLSLLSVVKESIYDFRYLLSKRGFVVSACFPWLTHFLCKNVFLFFCNDAAYFIRDGEKTSPFVAGKNGGLTVSRRQSQIFQAIRRTFGTKDASGADSSAREGMGHSVCPPIDRIDCYLGFAEQDCQVGENRRRGLTKCQTVYFACENCVYTAGRAFVWQCAILTA